MAGSTPSAHIHVYFSDDGDDEQPCSTCAVGVLVHAKYGALRTARGLPLRRSQSWRRVCEGVESMVQAQVHKKDHTIGMLASYSVSYPKYPRWVPPYPFGQREWDDTSFLVLFKMRA